jgi:TPR repeat protein
VAVPKPSPATPPVSFDDRLVADGERYLYGRGVPEDCARAQRNLQIGAGNSNPKAQTLLGAMYATGHCVNRDLPTAYRWFAKALHGDPGNSRVQRDLEVLWKQMTPEERQLAMKSR